MRRLAALSLFVAAVAMLPSPASAAENFYVILRGGPAFTPDINIGPPGREEADGFGVGFTGGSALGYSFPFGLRAEGEFGLIYAPVKTDGGVDASGSFTNFLVMANAYYDFKLFGPIKPFVGVGLGGARVHEDRRIFADGIGRFIDVDDWRTRFAAQARAGIGYDVNRWLDLSVGYRFVRINGGDAFPNHFRVEHDAFINHSIEFGAAFKF